MTPDTTAKDLTKVAPRSPKLTAGGYAILLRTIDKCRASIAGTIGEYHFDCPLDKQLFGFKNIVAEEFKAYVAEGHTDEEILSWVVSHGTTKTPEEVSAWTMSVIANNYSGQPEKKAWLEGENAKVGLPKDATLFDFLDADDIASFKK